jgi:hypothetical protein
MLELNHTLFEPSELDGAASRIIELVARSLAAQEIVVGAVALSQNARSDLQRTLARSDKSGFTDLLDQRDGERDDAFVVLRDYSQTMTRRKDATLRAAALRLAEKIRLRGNRLARLGYTEQSGVLEALIADLRSAESQADLEKIGAKAMFEDLVEAQNEFAKAAANKLEAEKDLHFTPLRAAWRELALRLQFLLTLAETLHDIETQHQRAGHAALLSQLENLMTELHAPVRARQTREDNAAKQSATPPASSPPPAS